MKAPPPSRSGLSGWARENPAGFAGVWFAVAAGLLAAQSLIFLPTLVVNAWSHGGPEGRLLGTVAAAYICFAPSLVALVAGAVLGGSIVSPGYPDGRAPTARGALVGAVSLAIWLLMGTALLGVLSDSVLGGWGEVPPGAAEAAALVLFPGPVLVVAAVGAGAGYLLHALVGRQLQKSPGVPGR